ncbi:alpha/beta hydrolase family protein [Rufibacter immobilis]|uniref:alpha/beta hydrolase family protein n=1 Tax=Rufibacter immobilis TaxID=1348778 RepID=UPI001C83F726|nr:acetylxylan esterase [Rufibacter immobilis]
MKKTFCAWLMAVGLAPAAFAQSSPQALTWKAQTTFNAYLLRDLHAAYDQRRERLQKALASPQALKEYQAQAKRQYLSVLGQFPEKGPLNAKTTRQLNQKGYRIENVIYQSRPNHHATANLYVPQGKGPFPAVVLLNGHEMTSKATESYQKTARLFALNGFVVLSIDPFSQGERVQLTDKTGKSLTRGSTTEHTLLNAGANLVGSSVAAYMLWDNLRGIDYLETRPEVDRNRIGAIGNSGGGTQTAYLMAYDIRIKVAAPCSYFTLRERSLELGGIPDGCQFIPGEEQLEFADFLLMSGPKPLLLLAGEHDFVDYRGVQEGYQELQKVYATLGQPQQLKLFTWPDGHGISRPKREVAVAWFRKWLYQDEKPVQEGEIGTLPEKDLLATTTGQANTAFAPETTIPDVTYRQFKALAPQRQAFLAEQNTAALQAKVREVIGWRPNTSPVSSELSGESQGKNYRLEKRILLRQGELPLPVLIYRPLTGKPHKLVIRLEEKGKAAAAKNDSLIQGEMAAGNVLVLPDLRGVGETQDDPKLNDPKYWTHEYRNAVLSLHLKRPLLGQRVQDLVTLLDFLHAQPHWKNLPVHVWANGLYGPVLTHAAFLDERITQAQVAESISSFETYLVKPIQQNMYSNVVPGLLQFYDLPDLVNRSNARIKNLTL